MNPSALSPETRIELALQTEALIRASGLRTNVLDEGIAFVIRVTFPLTGPLVLAANVDYLVHVSLERFGEDTWETDLPTQVVPAAAYSNQSLAPPYRVYVCAVPGPPDAPPGAYKVSCLVTSLVSGIPGPVAGFTDEQILIVEPARNHRPSESDLVLYHRLADAKLEGRITPEESKQLDMLDRKFDELAAREEKVFRMEPGGPAARLEMAIQKADELLAELRRSRQKA